MHVDCHFYTAVVGDFILDIKLGRCNTGWPNIEISVWAFTDRGADKYFFGEIPTHWQKGSAYTGLKRLVYSFSGCSFIWCLRSPKRRNSSNTWNALWLSPTGKQKKHQNRKFFLFRKSAVIHRFCWWPNQQRSIESGLSWMAQFNPPMSVLYMDPHLKDIMGSVPSEIAVSCQAGCCRAWCHSHKLMAALKLITSHCGILALRRSFLCRRRWVMPWFQLGLSGEIWRVEQH